MSLTRCVRSANGARAYSSHRFDEVFRLADRVTVLRDGRVVTTAEVATFDHDKVVHALAGAESERLYKPAGGSGDVVMRVRDITGRRLRGVSFELREGEILGIAGLRGSGREDIAPLLFGRDPAATGAMTVGGADVELPTQPGDAIAAGLALVPADRLRAANLPMLPLREKIVISNLRAVAPRSRIERSRERQDVATWISEVGIIRRSGIGGARSSSAAAISRRPSSLARCAPCREFSC